ncbi:MAG: hypothetical protein IKN72_09290 [Clostridia bacterium]|nr:hypothetical protein [Clostridia bacterium]
MPPQGRSPACRAACANGPFGAPRRRCRRGPAAAVPAAQPIERIDFTVRSDIAGYTYRDYKAVFSVETEGFCYLYSPISSSAMTAYHDGAAYRDKFRTGETYLLSMAVYYPGELELADDFGIYANGQKLSYAQNEYEMVYNPASNQTNLAIRVEVTVTESQGGDPFLQTQQQNRRSFAGPPQTADKPYVLQEA